MFETHKYVYEHILSNKPYVTLRGKVVVCLFENGFLAVATFLYLLVLTLQNGVLPSVYTLQAHASISAIDLLEFCTISDRLVYSFLAISNGKGIFNVGNSAHELSVPISRLGQGKFFLHEKKNPTISGRIRTHDFQHPKLIFNLKTAQLWFACRE